MTVGDRVVCISSQSTGHGLFQYSITKGRIYIVRDVFCCSCDSVSLDIGIDNTSPYKVDCVECHADLPTSVIWARSKFFAPIVFNSATEELANKEIVKEVSDIPIKEPHHESKEH